MAKTNQIPINGDALKEALRIRGLTQAEVSRRLGCGCGISNAIMRNYITKPLMLLLKSEYEITEEELAKQPTTNVTRTKPKADPQEIIIAPQISDDQWTKFEEVIKTAILEALREGK